MLQKIIGFIWQKTPRVLRLPLIRVTQPKFTVSAAALVTNRENEVLLLKHVLRPFYKWGLPGGFINHGEQPETAVKREIYEETGLQLEKVRLIQILTIKRHVEMFYRAESRGTPEVKSLEIIRAEWLPVSRLPENLSPLQKSFIEKVLNSEI